MKGRIIHPSILFSLKEMGELLKRSVKCPKCGGVVLIEVQKYPPCPYCEGR